MHETRMTMSEIGEKKQMIQKCTWLIYYLSVVAMFGLKWASILIHILFDRKKQYFVFIYGINKNVRHE